MRFLKVFICVAIGCGFLSKLPYLSAQGEMSAAPVKVALSPVLTLKSLKL